MKNMKSKRRSRSFVETCSIRNESNTVQNEKNSIDCNIYNDDDGDG